MLFNVYFKILFYLLIVEINIKHNKFFRSIMIVWLNLRFLQISLLF